MQKFILSSFFIFLSICQPAISQAQDEPEWVVTNETPSEFVQTISSTQKLCSAPIVLFDNNENGIIVWGTYDGTHTCVFAANYTHSLQSITVHKLSSHEHSRKLVIQAAISPNGKAVVSWSLGSAVTLRLGLGAAIYDNDRWETQTIVPFTTTLMKWRNKDASIAINDSGIAVIAYGIKQPENSGERIQVASYYAGNWSAKWVTPGISFGRKDDIVIGLNELGDAALAYSTSASDGECASISVFFRHGLSGPWKYTNNTYFKTLSYFEQHERYYERDPGQESEPLQHPFKPLSLSFISPNIIRLTAVEMQDYITPLCELSVDINY